jgi:hypothetical protein
MDSTFLWLTFGWLAVCAAIALSSERGRENLLLLAWGILLLPVIAALASLLFL